jgi:hypothetical protein
VDDQGQGHADLERPNDRAIDSLISTSQKLVAAGALPGELFGETPNVGTIPVIAYPGLLIQ